MTTTIQPDVQHIEVKLYEHTDEIWFLPVVKSDDRFWVPKLPICRNLCNGRTLCRSIKRRNVKTFNSRLFTIRGLRYACIDCNDLPRWLLHSNSYTSYGRILLAAVESFIAINTPRNDNPIASELSAMDEFTLNQQSLPVHIQPQNERTIPSSHLDVLASTVNRYVEHNESRVSDVNSRVSTVESRGTVLQQALATTNEALKKVDAEHAKIVRDLNALKVAIATFNDKLTPIHNRLVNNESHATTLAGRIMAFEDTIQELKASDETNFRTIQQTVSQLLNSMTSHGYRRSHPFTVDNISKENITQTIRFLDERGIIPNIPEDDQSDPPRNKFREFYYTMYQLVLGTVPERGHQNQHRIDGLSRAQLLACYNWLYDYAQLALLGRITDRAVPLDLNNSPQRATNNAVEGLYRNGWGEIQREVQESE